MASMNPFNGDLALCSAQIKGPKKRCCQRRISEADREKRVQLLNVLLNPGEATGMECVPDLYFCKAFHRPGGKYAVGNEATNEVLSQLRSMSTDQLQQHIDATTIGGAILRRTTPPRNVSSPEESTRSGSRMNSSRTSNSAGRIPQTDIHVVPPPVTAGGNTPMPTVLNSSNGPRRSARVQAQQEIHSQVSTRTANSVGRTRQTDIHLSPPPLIAGGNTAKPTVLNNRNGPRRSARVQAQQEAIHSRVAAQTPRSFRQHTATTRVRGHNFSIDETGRNDGRCYICYDDFDDSKSVSTCAICRHRLHSACATEWFDVVPKCPICRVVVSEEERIVIKAAA